MAEITVDVGVRLKAMQSSVADLQKVLDGLQPNSSGFKALQKIIADINRDIDRLKIQTSKPFGSQNQFNQTEKTVGKLEESLEKVKITIDRIKFSDLKLDSSQTAQLDNFKQQLSDIKQEFTVFKADLKTQFLDNDFNKAFVEGINPNLINKNFDEIVKNVENRVNSLGSTLAKAKADLEEFQNAFKIGEKIDKASQSANGVVSPDFMGQDMFDKFFQTNSKGIFSFKTGGGLKKGEIQQQFLDYLTGEFQLNQSQIDQLKNQTAGNIRKILMQDDFFNPQKSAAETANKKMSGAESNFTAASKNYENAVAVIARLNPLIAALTNEETSLEDKQKLVNQAIRQFEQDCVNGAKGSKTMDTALNGLDSQLNSFKTQLGQVNVQWLNLQKQQATFNSMKFAIVNFMGFNQVLNLTKKAVKEAMDHIKQLDTVMNGIAIVTDMTTADLWNQVDVYSEMAQRYGTSIQGAYEVSKIYYQAGYETNDVLTLMNETLKMSKISGLDYATTTDYMMNAIKGFKMEVADAASVVDVYSALAANTAVSQQELAEAMSKTASSMAGVGSTFEDTSAMIATMVSVTRESANNIGSAMKSIASRYGELTKDPTKLLDSEGEAMSFNKVDTALKSVGITLQTTDHQFRDFTDVIVELASKWDTLDSAQQRYIATQFAGNRQQNRFLALVSNKDLLQENMEVAAASEDTGTLQALKALDSLESKLNQVQVAYQQFYTTIGAEGVWKTVLDGIKNFVDSLNGLPKVFDKIPLGAVAVLGNLIGLVKTALLNGLTTIAQEWNNIMNNTNNNAADMAQNGGDKIGKTWIGALFSAIKEGQPKIEEAMAEAIGRDNQKAQSEVKYTGTKINTEDFLFKNYYSKNFNPNDTKVAADTYLQTLVSMEQAGTQFSQSTLNQLLDIGAAVENGSINLREAGQRAIQIIQDTGSVAETNTSKVSNFWKELGKSGSNWQKGLTGLSQSLTTIGMLLDKTSESGRIMSGVMTGLGGAVQTGVAAARVMVQDWSALPQLIMGIFNVINGVGIAWETDAERLERLTKEAENLTNESKRTKAEYNTLQRSIDKLDELEKKRYDSAEAAEEYQTAVDELANQFPQLVTSLDEMGNATIETANLEYELENARKAAAEATLKAAQAEREKTESELKIAQDELLNTHNSISNDEGEVVSNFFNPDYSKVGKRTLTDITIPDWFGETSVLKMLNIDPNKQYNQQEILQRLAFSGNFAINQDEYGNFELPDKNYITDVLENMYSVGKEAAELFYKQISSLTDETHKINTEQVEDFSKAIQELEPENDNFNNTVAKLAHDIAEAKLQEIFPDFMNYASDLANGLEKVNQFSEILASTERVELSAAINTYGKEQQAFVENLGEGNSILTQYLYSQAEQYGDVEQYITNKLKQDYEIFKNAYEAFEPKDQEKFLEMWKNRSQYTIQDFSTLFDFNGKESVLQGLQDYYAKQIPDYQKMLKEKISKNLQGSQSDLAGVRFLTNSITHGKDIISQDLMVWLSGIVDIINDYSASGKITAANTIAYGAYNIFESLENIIDPTSRASIVGVLNKYSLSTISGIDSIIQDIEGIDGSTAILPGLNKIKSALTYNLPLAIQAYTDQIVNDAEDLEKNIKNISNGMSISEAMTALEKINSTDGLTASLADFTEKNGKFYIKDAQLRERYVSAVLDNETKELDALRERANIFKENKQLADLMKSDADKQIFDIDNYKDIYDTLKDLGLIEDYYEKDKETGENVLAGFKISEDFNEILGDNDIYTFLENYFTNALASATEVANYIRQSLPAREALAAGKYQEYLKKLKTDESGALLINESQIPDLKDIASGRVSSTKEYTYEQLKELRDKLNSDMNTFVSDVLSKGIENINIQDYNLDEFLVDEKFIDENQVVDYSRATQALREKYKNNAQKFIEDYGAYLGNTIEEQNALMIQAIEKDTQATTGAAAEAVGKIQWLSSEGKGFAALKDIQTLADALGISVDKILGEYNNQLDMYLVDLSNVEGIDLSAIDGFSDTVKDSINAFLKQIFENVNKAITGKLSNADVTTLTGQLEQLGLKDITLDFTQTVDGLKLSQRSAMGLYNELKKINALQAQLVFDELAKSLEASDTNYTNISTTLARIAELEKAIQGMKPDDARLQMYKNELAVAQEIARTRSSTDNKDFNFMDRALPNGMQNPIDYWNATGEAYKVMNASAKSGYMEIQDFYNIVQEMSNMAQVSGQTLHFMGQEIDGSAETAAALIQKGFSALTNVKGDGVKIALGNIGADFKTGAADMKGDFDSGIREMAKAQIQMLDAAINMLEAIVAMENIGDIDTNGNGIDYGELFDDIWDPNNEEWITKWDKDAQTTIDGIVKAGEKNPELKKAFESFYLEGYSLWELLKDDGEKLTKIGKEGRDKLVEAFNIINELANSDDWEIGNLEQIYKKIEASGLQDLFSQHIYNEEAGFSLIITPDIQTEIDWNSPEIEKRLKETGFKTDEEARKFLDAFAKGEKTEPIDYVTVKILSGDIEITDENTYKYHGQEFTDKAKLAEIIDKEKSFDAELNNIDTESNTVTFSKTIGLQKVTIVQEEDGTTTYKFEDGTTIKAPDEETALKLYAENYRQTHSSLANLSDEEILMQWHLLVEEQVEIKINEKVDKQIRDNAETFRNHTIQEINEAIEKGTTTANGEGIIINLGDKTFTLSGTKEELSGKGQEIADLAAQELGIDTALSTTISDGISQAFSGESGAKISKAITDGITDAFTDTEKIGEDNALPVPAITLKPESVTIQLGEKEPTVQGLDEAGIKITSVNISADSAYVSSEKYQAGTAGAPLTTVTLEAIDSATGEATTLYVNCPDGSVVGNTVTLTGFTANGTATTFTVDNTTGELSTKEAINVPILKADGSITGFFWVDPSSAAYTGLKPGTKIENLKGISKATGEAVSITVECGEKTSVNIDDANVTIDDTVKATAENGEVTLTKYTVTTTDAEGNIDTIEVYGEAALTATLTEYGAGFENNAPNTSGTINLTANEVGIDINTNNATSAWNDWLANKNGSEIEIKTKIISPDVDDSLNQSRVNIATARIGQPEKGLGGKGAAKKAMGGEEAVKEYVSQMHQLVQAGQSLSEVDLSNLEYIKSIFSGGLAGSIEGIDSIIALSQINENNGLDQLSTLAQSFSGLEIGDLPEIATALEDIATQAQVLEKIGWDKIAEGMTGIMNAQTGSKKTGGNGDSGTPASNNNQSGGGIIDTTTLTGAIAEVQGSINSLAEVYGSARDAINEIASSVTEINTNNITTATNAISDTKSQAAVIASTAINNIDAAGAIAAKQNINSIEGKNIKITAQVGVTVTQEGTKAAGNVTLKKQIPSKDSKIKIASKGNVALASGRNTLMGELGPELVVSKGRYFVVGQNGPEMVNLADDAIVFNHIQTRQLLANGKTGTHATPVTNERKATSLATGNANGPAMASASAALAALKQLRAMWQSLADASLKDLGAMPSGGGGGGGGGGGNSAKEVEAVTHEVEKWFNWQQEIEESQERINKLTKEYNLLTAQGISSQKQVNNLKQKAAQLTSEINTREQWLNEANAKQTKLAKEGNEGLAGLFYGFDAKTGRRYLLNDDERNDNFVKYLKNVGASGKLAKVLKDSGKIAAGTNLKYKTVYDQQDADAEAEAEYQAWLQTKKGKKASDKAKEKQRKKIQDKINKKVGTELEKDLTIGYDITSGASLMNVLQEKDEAGNNKLNGRAQYKILEELGIIAANPILMSGIDKSQDDWEAQVVENFYNGIDNFVEEWETNTDVIKENEEALLDNKIAIQEINDQLRETMKPVTGVTEGLEAWYNELKRIEAVEERINILSKENNNLQNDHIANGKAIFENEMAQVKQLEKQRELNNDLYSKEVQERDNLVKKYQDLPISYDPATGVATFNEQKYNKTVDASYTDIAKNSLGYEIDEQGRYVDKEGILRDAQGNQLDETKEILGTLKTIAINSTYSTNGKTLPDILKDITSQDATGEVKFNAEQQYNILKSLGFEKFLQFNENGEKISKDFGELSKEEMQSAVEAGISRIQNAADEINDATADINKLEEDNLDIQASLYEIQQVLIDNAIELQNLVKEAIVQERQNVIDQKTEIKDILDKTVNKTIEGLRNSLERERKLSESDKDTKELSTLQAQLAVMRSSGGALSKIRDLENQIQDKQRDMYFTERENSIDDLEDNAQKQIDALETQIDIMQTSLDYQVEHGLIWANVNRKISETGPESLAGFIVENQKDFLGKAPTEQAEELIRIIETAQIYAARKASGYNPSNLPKFAKGGDIKFTGPARVDGTTTKPEHIFNFEQMEQLREKFLENLAVTQVGISGLSSIIDNLPNTNSYNSISNEDNGITIGQLEFHMEVKEIANDYDARRAGREAMEEMVRIARKTGNRAILRR